ncbi:RimJ/RimL family protein N-acetyltransferase [Salirhabdus euzebyi]|uniref:RimJ/RimL family protein N-acetyltransferase n=1 Tax=Salirhabdus euzebyi TaxID=394506 RepID=A0A841PUI7_9BACI|nr:GNAT family N-acetyltransferase [Salirhabdus euzebyi]MBB6452667.1 RimJ/RimL family protein N-acetyltransferase [Salirhabdus euzebyi]
MYSHDKKFNHVSTTNRLIIRPLKFEDYKNWLHAFKNRFPSQHRYDEGRIDMSECTYEWYSALVAKHQYLALNDVAYVFGVFRKRDGAHLGMVDFSTLARSNFQWGRIGYGIHNQYWGNGYGKEAVKEALNIGFSHLHFHRIEAHINLDNIVSKKLAESVGMKFECIREGFIHEFGEWTDNLVYYVNAN